MVDALRRKLKVPCKFVPYMEKHCMYDIFHELTNRLILEQPKDHLVFLRENLRNIAATKNSKRVIIISPPHLDLTTLAQHLPAKKGAQCIFLADIQELDARKIAKKMKQILSGKENSKQNGWILFDYPRNREDALALQRAGILPTHTLLLVPSSESNYGPTTNRSLSSICPEDRLQQEMQNDVQRAEVLEYRKRLLDLRSAYQSTVHDVDMQDLNMKQLADVCDRFIATTKPRGAPMLPRVLIIGMRGSGRMTQAKLLIDFEHLLEKTKLTDEKMAQKLLIRKVQKLLIEPKILASILEKRLLNKDCLDQGWVLTGFPTTVAQFRALDAMDTPPNRVIFLDADRSVCLKRVVLRCSNKYTGSDHNLLDISRTGESNKHLGMHPRDKRAVVEKEIEQYLANLPEILKYVAGSESHVNGNALLRTVTEEMEAVIMNPPPNVPHRRTPKPQPTILVNKPSVRTSVDLGKGSPCVYTLNDLSDSLDICVHEFVGVCIAKAISDLSECISDEILDSIDDAVYNCVFLYEEINDGVMETNVKSDSVPKNVIYNYFNINTISDEKYIFEKAENEKDKITDVLNMIAETSKSIRTIHSNPRSRHYYDNSSYRARAEKKIVQSLQDVGKTFSKDENIAKSTSSIAHAIGSFKFSFFDDSAIDLVDVDKYMESGKGGSVHFAASAEDEI